MPPADLLTDLVAGARADSAERRLARPLADVERDALALPAARDAVAALAPRTQVRIIAEIKRRSPSRGPLASITDPVDLATTYQNGGASAISVLTERRRFDGSLDDLAAVSQAVTIPVLRKDFVTCAYQVFEARAAGADMVLLIVAALDQPTLVELHDLITSLGMAALVETHSADEITRAVDCGARLIGVNARNLSTFELDPQLFGRLSDGIPDHVIKIAESAVTSAADVAHYRSSGADVVLVGEALVTGDPLSQLEKFLEV